VRLANDPRFSKFVAGLKTLSAEQKVQLLDHAIGLAYNSRVVPKAIPPLSPTYLTYARSTLLCEKLLNLPTEGHVPQFLVAAFLETHRARLGLTITTHHPHAADRFDETAGDIEEFHDGRLTCAYEVTIRDDWKNRLPDFRAKMTEASLRKYWIIARDVTNDPALYPASRLVEFCEPLNIDLAVVDIGEFFRVFCAELTAGELMRAFNAPTSMF
jgi:hypothetical protein